MNTGKGRKIGLMGGTFDPLHVGHLVAACYAQCELDLDEVQFVVAGEPWQKSGRLDIAPAEVRFRAVEAVLNTMSGGGITTGLLPGRLTASRVEVDRQGPTYTVDTLRECLTANSDARFFLIVGADTANQLHTWVRPDEVAELAELVVVDRPGVQIRQLPPIWRVHRVQIPLLEVSSTDLRERMRAGKSVDFLVPEAALEIYAANHQYSLVR